jgi:hypothetical protein
MCTKPTTAPDITALRAAELARFAAQCGLAVDDLDAEIAALPQGELTCDYCWKVTFTGPLESLVEDAFEANWAIWPRGTAMCPACCKKYDHRDCAAAWRIERVMTGGRA